MFGQYSKTVKQENRLNMPTFFMFMYMSMYMCVSCVNTPEAADVPKPSQISNWLL